MCIIQKTKEMVKNAERMLGLLAFFTDDVHRILDEIHNLFMVVWNTFTESLALL